MFGWETTILRKAAELYMRNETVMKSRPQEEEKIKLDDYDKVDLSSAPDKF